MNATVDEFEVGLQEREDQQDRQDRQDRSGSGHRAKEVDTRRMTDQVDQIAKPNKQDQKRHMAPYLGERIYGSKVQDSSGPHPF